MVEEKNTQLYNNFMRVLLSLLFFLCNVLNAKDYIVDSTASLKLNTIDIDEYYKSTIAELEVRWTDSNGEFGLGKCNAHVISKKNKEIIDAYCENLDSSGDKFWTHLNRNSSQIEAGIGIITYINGTGKYKKLIDKKCNYAVSYFDKLNIFFKQICKI